MSERCRATERRLRKRKLHAQQHTRYNTKAAEQVRKQLDDAPIVELLAERALDHRLLACAAGQALNVRDVALLSGNLGGQTCANRKKNTICSEPKC